MMILLSNAYDAEMADRAPQDPVVMENAIGVANLNLFFFFLLDMFLQFMIQGVKLHHRLDDQVQ